MHSIDYKSVKFEFAIAFAIVVAVFGILFLLQTESEVEIISDAHDEITFVGTISSSRTQGCFHPRGDDECSFMVGDWEVVNGLWPNSSLGFSADLLGTERKGTTSTPVEPGTRVKVYAQRIGDKKVSIYGSEEYYVKEAKKSNKKPGAKDAGVSEVQESNRGDNEEDVSQEPKSTTSTSTTSTTTQQSTSTTTSQPQNKQGGRLQEYDNDTLELSFEYPASWNASTDSRDKNQTLICLNPDSDRAVGDCAVSLTINEKGRTGTLNENREELYEEYDVEESWIRVANTTAKELRVSGYADNYEGNARELLFEKNDRVIIVSATADHLYTYNQIVRSLSVHKANDQLTEVSFTGDDYNRSIQEWSTYEDSDLGIKFGYPADYRVTDSIVPEATTTNEVALLGGRLDTEEKLERIIKMMQFTADEKVRDSRGGLVSGANFVAYAVYDYEFGSNEFWDTSRDRNGQLLDVVMDTRFIPLDKARKQNGVRYYMARPYGNPRCFSASVYIPKGQKTGALHIHECREGESTFRHFSTDATIDLMKRYIEAKYLSTLEKM
jgi:hypothetical protein